MPVPRVVGGNQIENDLVGRRLVGLEEEGDEQALDRDWIVPDLVVAARFRRRVFEPVQGAFAGERSASRARGLELAGQRRQDRCTYPL
jgi:hypothetical protein